MTILVTGGAGFIGSALVRHLVLEANRAVVNVDSLTYAGNLASLGDARLNERHSFERVDIRDVAGLERVFATYSPTAVVHLAAESHVDRSISGPSDFVATNILGTASLLDVVFRYWESLAGDAREAFRFHHVSTDEVYGDLGPQDSPFDEDSPYRPSSPYSASKASSDHLVRAWHRTYGLPTLITNCSNNYGPYQFPEKLMPLMILRALQGGDLPVYGDGSNIRDWLFVEDHVSALVAVLEKGAIGATYNIGGDAERTNIDVVRRITRLLDELAPSADGPYERLIRFVTDRPGHDRRYAIDGAKIRRDLSWTPQTSFDDGLRKTVSWYLEHSEWLEGVQSGEYRNWVTTHYDKDGAAR